MHGPDGADPAGCVDETRWHADSAPHRLEAEGALHKPWQLAEGPAPAITAKPHVWPAAVSELLAMIVSACKPCSSAWWGYPHVLPLPTGVRCT